MHDLKRYAWYFRLTYNYRAWALVVLTIATEALMDSGWGEPKQSKTREHLLSKSMKALDTIRLQFEIKTCIERWIMLKLKSVIHTYSVVIVQGNPCLVHYGRLVCQITLEVTYQLSSISPTFINYDDVWWWCYDVFHVILSSRPSHFFCV